MAVQSSTYQNHYASYAVDGTIHNSLNLSSCSYTKHQMFPWWEVNFGQLIEVQKVDIHNLDCCGGKLSIYIHCLFLSSREHNNVPLHIH